MPTTSATITFKSMLEPSSSLGVNQQQQRQPFNNVAVVSPLIKQTTYPEPVNPVNHPCDNSIGGSFLPPPSDLLLSGFGTSTRGKDPLHSPHHQYQPLFAISGHYGTKDPISSAPVHPYLRYGTNGIPILEPSAPLGIVGGASKFIQEQRAPAPPTTRTITLGELDTGSMLNRVKASVDFARFLRSYFANALVCEECEQLELYYYGHCLSLRIIGMEFEENGQKRGLESEAEDGRRKLEQFRVHRISPMAKLDIDWGGIREDEKGWDNSRTEEEDEDEDGQESLR